MVFTDEVACLFFDSIQQNIQSILYAIGRRDSPVVVDVHPVTFLVKWVYEGTFLVFRHHLNFPDFFYDSVDGSAAISPPISHISAMMPSSP